MEGAILGLCIGMFILWRSLRRDIAEVPRPQAKVYAIDAEYTAAVAWRGIEIEGMIREHAYQMASQAFKPAAVAPALKIEAKVESKLQKNRDKQEARQAKARAELAEIEVQAARERQSLISQQNQSEYELMKEQVERARLRAIETQEAIVVTTQAAPVTEVVPPQEVEKAVLEAVPVYFKPGEPTTFEEYGMQRQVTEYLRASIDGLRPDEASIGNYLFSGPPGLGKTMLAKVITNELRARNLANGWAEPDFIEVFPVDIEDSDKLDSLIRRAIERPGSVFFIDEVHDLVDRHAYKLYLTLAEQRYKFAEDRYPTALPPLTFLAATTDVGLMHPALRRRFEILNLLPVGKPEIERAVLMRPFRIAPDAVELLVSRTHFCGAPWEALQVFEQSKKFARAGGKERVEVGDVEKVFSLNGIDELGLSSLDRKVIQVLFTQPKLRKAKGGGNEFVAYGCSEENLCLMAQLDRSQWREVVMPKLMSRGLLTTKAGVGRVLTESAESTYAKLKPGNAMTP